MRLKNSFRMLINNYHVTYKVLLYRVIVLTILLAFASFIVIPNFNTLIEQSGIRNLINSVIAVIKNLFNPQSLPEANNFVECLAFVKDYFASHGGRVVGFAFILIAFYVVGVFLLNFSIYALGVVVNDHMSTLSHRGFVIDLFTNIGSATIYSLISLAYTTLSILICGGLAIGTYVLLSKAIGIVALFFALLVYIAVWSIIKAYASDFLPALLADNMKIKDAAKKTFSHPQNDFWRMFSYYFSMSIIIIYLNISVAVFTFFVGLLLTIPITALWKVSFRFVSYYTMEKKKFYISETEIDKPKDSTEDENVLKDILD